MAGDNFDEFYKDLKETERKDSTLTPKQQIDRLLRPGSTYRNLNPYEVLQIDPELPLDEVKKKYRRLSILVRKVAKNIKVKVIRQYLALCAVPYIVFRIYIQLFFSFIGSSR